MADKESQARAAERVAFFSDAVIAIAITLLALELPVPEGDDLPEVLASFSHHGHEYLVFLLTFVVIGGTWIGHHKLFRFIVATDHWLLAANLVALFALVLVPWASKALTTAHHGTGIALYSLVMATIGGANLWFTLHSIRAGLLHEDTPDSFSKGIWVKAGLPAAVFAVSAPLALLVGEWVYVLWPIVYLGIIVYYTAKRLSARRTSGSLRTEDMADTHAGGEVAGPESEQVGGH